jgi:hypothetical protein
MKLAYANYAANACFVVMLKRLTSLQNILTCQIKLNEQQALIIIVNIGPDRAEEAQIGQIGRIQEGSFVLGRNLGTDTTQRAAVNYVARNI